MSNIITSKLDANQVIRKAYDDDTNRLRVDAQVSATISEMDVIIDAAGGDNIAITDPTGTNYLLPNPDGSLSVVISDSGLTTKNIFNEVSSVASGVLTTIATYTALANTNLLKVDVGGTNIAEYSIYIGGVLQSKKYTYFQNLNETLDFKDGLPVTTGALIEIKVLHNRPDLGNFNTNILIKN